MPVKVKSTASIHDTRTLGVSNLVDRNIDKLNKKEVNKVKAIFNLPKVDKAPFIVNIWNMYGYIVWLFVVLV